MPELGNAPAPSHCPTVARESTVHGTVPNLHCQEGNIGCIGINYLRDGKGRLLSVHPCQSLPLQRDICIDYQKSISTPRSFVVGCKQ